MFEECPKAKTCTLLLRGGAEQFIEEVERSLHDAIMVVKRAVKNGDVVAGGGAIEVCFHFQHRICRPSQIVYTDDPFRSYSSARPRTSWQAPIRAASVFKGLGGHPAPDL